MNTRSFASSFSSIDELKDALLKNTEAYFSRDKGTRLDGWQEMGIYLAPTLQEAWLVARPQDALKFQDERFAKMVNRANGKWLEAQCDDDMPMIILAVSGTDTVTSLTGRLVHELTHACCYRDASAHLTFEQRHPGTSFFVDCSEFRATYADTRFQIVSQLDSIDDKTAAFEILASVLGIRSADAVAGIMRSRDSQDLHGVRYFMARYIGSLRALSDVDREMAVRGPFALWHMVPKEISEAYPMAFYLGNEWKSRELTIDSEPEERYYNEFMESAKKYIGGTGQSSRG